MENAQVDHVEQLTRTQSKAKCHADEEVPDAGNIPHAGGDSRSEGVAIGDLISQKVNGGADESLHLPEAVNHAAQCVSKVPDDTCPTAAVKTSQMMPNGDSVDLEVNTVPTASHSVAQLNSDSSGSDAKGVAEAVSSSEIDIRDVVNGDGVECEVEKSKEDDGDWILVLGHDQLKKRVIRPGEANSRPEKGQLVTVRCAGRLDDGTEIDIHDSLQLCLGDDDFISAFDLCIPLMDRGELCQVVTEHRFAYGEIGREPDVPPNARVTYDIELLEVQDLPAVHTMTVAYRVQLSNKKRERGNLLFTRGEHSRAVDVYNRALEIVNDENEAHVESADELKSLADTRVKCYNNLAAAQLKLEAWDAAIRSCDLALRTDPDNVKALFRKGKCLAGKGDYDAAVPTLRRALKLEPDSRIIQQELARVDSKLREANRSQKELYQKMLGTDKLPADIPKAPADQMKRKKSDTRWIWYVAGALAAAIIPVAVAAFRYIYIVDSEDQEPV
jgi:FK506-binding protein 8